MPTLIRPAPLPPLLTLPPHAAQDHYSEVTFDEFCDCVGLLIAYEDISFHDAAGPLPPEALLHRCNPAATCRPPRANSAHAVG